jgi:hypothetical protein
MRTPADAVIPADKLTKYLLAERPFDDKSKLLSRAGFTLKQPYQLESAIREMIAHNDAVDDGANDYGTFFRVAGILAGPTSLPLQIVLIWLQWKSDGTFHFVTLKPHKG